MEKIKTIIKILVIIILLILICIFSTSYIINKNNDYKDNITTTIQTNYQVASEITYTNIYGNYYIFTTQNNVIVLNKEYEEILKENINILATNKNNYELIYKTNQLMYENTIIKNKTITYEYYDAKTYKKIKSTTLEK